jgi:tetratricopeptide (TPR) repeat protein
MATLMRGVSRAPMLLFLLLLVTRAAHAQWAQDAEKCATIVDDHDLAIRHCTAAIRSGRLSDEDLATAYNNRAYEYIARNEPDLARSDLDEALRLNDDNSHAWNNLGRLHRMRDDCEQAIPVFLEAIRRLEHEKATTAGYGTEFAANFNAGWCYHRLGRKSEGRPHIEKAFRLAPRYAGGQEIYRYYGLR